MDESLRKQICDEVARQMQPIEHQVTEVKRQNGEQTRKLDALGERLRALYGNGTGPPGYLEIARKEDREKYDDLFGMVSTLNEERLREAGKADMLRELDQAKDKRIDRIKNWAGLIAIPALSAVWTLVHPIVKAYFVYIAGQIK